MIGTTNLLTIAEVKQLFTEAGIEVRATTIPSLVDLGKIKMTGDGAFVRYHRDTVETFLEEKRQAENGNGENRGGEVPPNAQSKAVDRQGVGLTAQKVESVTPVTFTSPKRTVGLKNDNPDEMSEKARTLRQEIVDITTLTRLEAEKLEAETRRDEALRKRDLPEVLVKRENFVKAKEAELIARETAIKNTEVLQSQRVAAIDEKIKQADAKLAEADSYLADKKAEANQLISDAKFSADEAQLKLDGLNDEIAKAEAKLEKIKPTFEEIEKKCNNYLHLVARHAVAHNNQAEHSSGQVQDYHYAQTNKAWGLEKEIKDFLKKVEAVFR